MANSDLYGLRLSASSPTRTEVPARRDLSFDGVVVLNVSGLSGPLSLRIFEWDRCTGFRVKGYCEHLTRFQWLGQGSHDSFVGRLPPTYCRDLATVKRLSQHGTPSIGDCLCRSRAGLSSSRRIAWWRKAIGVEKCHLPRVHVVVGTFTNVYKSVSCIYNNPLGCYLRGDPERGRQNLRGTGLIVQRISLWWWGRCQN